MGLAALHRGIEAFTVDYDRLEDTDLINRVAGGNTDALSALYDRYGRLVYSLSLRIVGDRAKAEEVTQEVYVALWQRASSFNSGRGKLATWLLAIAHHRSVDELRRKENRTQKVTLDNNHEYYAHALNSELGVEDQIWNNLKRHSVREAIRKLPVTQREVIMLAYFEGMTHSDIAERLTLPLGTVKTRIRLAMHKLRESLIQDGIEAES